MVDTAFLAQNFLSLGIRMSLYLLVQEKYLSHRRSISWFQGDRKKAQSVLLAPAVSQVSLIQIISIPLCCIWRICPEPHYHQHRQMDCCYVTKIILEMIPHIYAQLILTMVQRRFTGERIVFSKNGRSVGGRSIGYLYEK